MAFLPPLVWWPRIGQAVCIADNDEIYYLALASQAYFNHPTYLRDPVFADGGISLYPELPLLPGVLISRALGLGPMGIDLAWRFLSGLSISLTWYILARHYMKRRWVVAVMVAILLADGGILGSSLLLRQASNFAKLVCGKSAELFAGDPLIHREWRISTPALTMAFFLLHIWLIARARMLPTWRHLVLSGLSFGLLFYVYPYYWTAAGGALLIALALDAGKRRVYFWTGMLGAVLGLPHIITDMMLKQSTPADWLIRSGKMVARSHLSDLDIPIAGSIILIIGLYWVWTRRRDVIYIWALGAAGLLLFNNQVVTGLSIENYHWLYVWGPSLSFLLVLMADSLLPFDTKSAQRVFVILLAIGITDVAAGITLRVLEPTRNATTLELMNAYDKFIVQRPLHGTARLAPNSVIAGDVQFLQYAAILENARPLENYWAFLSPSISDAEWNRRKALNVYLLDPAASEDELWKRLSGVNWTGIPSDESRRISDRITLFRSIGRELRSNLDRYAIRYVALPADQMPPTYLKDGWYCLQSGPFWQLWERRL
jgi:hypothetical protein